MLKRLQNRLIQAFNNPHKIMRYLARYGKTWEYHIRSLLSAKGSFVTYSPQFGGRMNLRFKDSISSEIFLGKFEKDVCAFIRKFLVPGMVFFDVGANVGLYTLMASRLVGPLGQVHAFEPSPCEFDDLIRNIKLNSLNNIFANKIAISNQSRNSIPYYICPNGMGAFNSLQHPSHPFVKDLDLNIITIKSTTLDAYTKRHQIQKVDLIKLDIEGAELLALEGAKRLISQDDAPVIICELSDLTTAAYSTSACTIFHWLKDHGYSVYEFNLQTDSLVLTEEKKQYIYSNIIASKTAI